MHTPGPWVQKNAFGNESDDGALVGPLNDSPVCSLTGYYGQNAFKANAHLIAASPLLLEALERIANGYESPEHLREHSEDEYGLEYEEALEMAYENVQNDARRALAHARLKEE